MVLEAAVNGGATAIVTFNFLDFGASAAKFRIAILTALAALRRIRSRRALAARRRSSRSGIASRTARPPCTPGMRIPTDCDRRFRAIVTVDCELA
jgi:hypothetical protein